MNRAEYNKVGKWLADGQSVMVRVKNRGSNNPYGRKASRYAGSVLRVVRTTGENRCSLVAHEMNRSISLHYAELILLDETLPLTQVVRRPDPKPVPAHVKAEIFATQAQINLLQAKLKELRACL